MINFIFGLRHNAAGHITGDKSCLPIPPPPRALRVGQTPPPGPPPPPPISAHCVSHEPAALPGSPSDQVRHAPAGPHTPGLCPSLCPFRPPLSQRPNALQAGSGTSGGDGGCANGDLAAADPSPPADVFRAAGGAGYGAGGRGGVAYVGSDNTTGAAGGGGGGGYRGGGGGAGAVLHAGGGGGGSSFVSLGTTISGDEGTPASTGALGYAANAGRGGDNWCAFTGVVSWRAPRGPLPPPHPPFQNPKPTPSALAAVAVSGGEWQKFPFFRR